MLRTETIRRVLAAADVQKDPYAVAEVAGALMDANPGDAAGVHYARALAHLRLPAIGGRGGVAWSSRARRFAANVRALSERDAAGAALVDRAATALHAGGTAGRFDLHLSADGNYQIVDHEPAPGDGRWLGGLADHKAATQLWQFDRTRTPVPPAILFDGMGYGWLFQHVFATTLNTYNGYSAAIYLVEPDPLALAMALHLHDFQDVLRHPRTRWFIAESPEAALGALTEALRGTPAWTIPEQFIRCHLRARPPVDAEAAMAVLRGERSAARERALAAANEVYAGRTRADWAARFAGKPRLRILGITSRYTTVLQHAVTELQASAAELGHDMRVAIEPDDHSLENAFPEMLASFQPDLIVQISRLRHENPMLPRNVPFVCWDQDNLPCMRTEAAGASLDDLTFVAGHGALHGWSFLNWPRRNVIFCHPAASSHRYSGRAAAGLLAQHACDLSFISNASASPEAVAEQQAARWQSPAELPGLFRACAEQVLAQGRAGRAWEFSELQALVGTVATAQRLIVDDASRNELALSLALVSDRSFRHGALHWAADFADAHGKTLRLYGQGWDKHPRFAAYAAGPAAQGPQVQAIYQASKINLQLIEGGFLHSRSLDGLAAGGFFLARAAPNDSRSDALSQALFVLGRRAVALGLRTRREIEASADGDLRAAAETLREHLARYAPDEPLRALENWAALPQVPVVFEQLSEVRFSTEAEFGAMAARYLADGTARQRTAEAMRAVVESQFTHGRRLEQFVGHMASALAP